MKILTACILGLAWLGGPAAAQAGTNITGQVMNATTGKPLAHAGVTLVALQGAMQPVSTTTSDAQGRYRFSETDPGPFMVECDYEAVPYFAQVTAGQAETNLQVFEVSHNAALLGVDAEIMVLQPDAGQLAVVNEYRIENGVTPPVTLANSGGMFRFRVAPGAAVDMVRVVGPGEMPLAREAKPTPEKDVYAVDTPLRPGETSIQISYRVPYGALRALITETPAIKPAHFEVYVPGAMSFAGAGFTQVGAQDGFNVYGIASGPVAATVSFTVAGNAPMPAAPTAGADGSAAGSAAPSPADAQPAAVGAVPAPTFIEKNRWLMLGLLGLAAAIGFGVLLARPQAEPVGTGLGADDAQRLKDDLFGLELMRRRLGAEEYSRQRAMIEKRLDQFADREPAGS